MALKKCSEKLKKLDDSASSLRIRLLNATNQVNQLTSKSAAKKARSGAVYVRDGRYYAKWTTIPAKLIAEFQADKEPPIQIYLELRNMVINTPEKITHDFVVKTIRRYRDALPDDQPRILVKEYCSRRLEELRYVL